MCENNLPAPPLGGQLSKAHSVPEAILGLRSWVAAFVAARGYGSISLTLNFRKGKLMDAEFTVKPRLVVEPDSE